MKRVPLKRKTRLRQRSVKRVQADVDYEPIRLAVLARDGSCRRCCTTRDPVVHHIRRRSQGGTNEPSNLVRLCAACHGWVHDNPAKARALGLLDGGGGSSPAVASGASAPSSIQDREG